MFALHRIRYRSRALVALLPILGLTCLLIYGVPVGERTIWELTKEVALVDNAILRTELLAGKKRQVAIELATGKSRILPGADEFRFLSYYRYENSRGDIIRLPGSSLWTSLWKNEWRWTSGLIHVYAEDKNGTRISDYLIRGYPDLVGDHHLVQVIDLELEIRDLRSITEVKIQQIREPYDRVLSAIQGTSRFIRQIHAPEGEFIELYEIMGGEAKLLNTWVAPRQWRTFEGKIYGLLNSEKPTSQFVLEVRDSSGQLLENISLPPTYNSATHNARLHGGLVQLFELSSERYTYFDLETQQILRIPADLNFPRYTAANQINFVGTCEDNKLQPPWRWHTYSRDTQASGEIVLPGPSWGLAYTESGNRLLTSLSYGFSVIEASPDGSQILRIHSPYAWASWLMPTTSLLFLVWSTYWVRCSICDGGQAWLDAALITSLLAIAIWLRGTYVPSTKLLMVYNTCIWGAAIAVASACFVVGPGRLSIRFVAVAATFYWGILLNFQALELFDPTQAVLTEIYIALSVGLVCCILRFI